MGIICFNLQDPRQLLKSQLDMHFVFAPANTIFTCPCVYKMYIPVTGVFLQLNYFFKIPLKITVYA